VNAHEILSSVAVTATMTPDEEFAHLPTCCGHPAVQEEKAKQTLKARQTDILAVSPQAVAVTSDVNLTARALRPFS